MSDILESVLHGNTPNRVAFLGMIAVSELGQALIDVSDDGYNVIVGSTAEHPDLFTSYADHPRILVHLNAHLESTAAGRYQILARYYDAYRHSLSLPDFGKASQDAIAMQMIRECHALMPIDTGDIESAITACSSRWASLPGSNYGQHQNKMDSLIATYESLGGTVC